MQSFHMQAQGRATLSNVNRFFVIVISFHNKFMQLMTPYFGLFRWHSDNHTIDKHYNVLTEQNSGHEL